MNACCNFMEADNIIVAIGQAGDLDFARTEGMALTPPAMV